MEKIPVKAHINGVSCRLPQSDNVKEFWDNLINGVDMIGPTKWPVGLHGLPPRSGNLKNVNKFDFEYFGLVEGECDMRNPMLNCLLEVTYEAIVDSGLHLSQLQHTSVGYFLGCTFADMDAVLTSQKQSVLDQTRPYFISNIMKAFDLTGPGLGVDTACSSSVYALQLAVTSLMAGRCQYAFVAGSNMILNPNISLQFHRLQMLSPTGMSCAFDESANGYVRSDGIVVMLLSRSDVTCPRIYASIVDVGTNCDGHKDEAVIFPSKAGQKLLLTDMYNKNKIKVQDVFYVEAHGTGTQAGDLVELTAMSDVFCVDREQPLLVGSVKSNIGHCESAAGLAGLLKCVLSIHHKTVPPNLNFNKPNPKIAPLTDGRILVVDVPTPLEDKLIGVSSFGFGGANGHIILKPYNNERRSQIEVPSYIMLPVMARDPDGFTKITDFVDDNSSCMTTLSLVHKSMLTKDTQQPLRGSILLGKKTDDMLLSDCLFAPKKSPLCVVLHDISYSSVTMDKDMLQIPAFKESFQKSSKILKSLGYEQYMFTDITADDAESGCLDIVKGTLCLLALLDTLKASKIEVDTIVAYGLSELAVACYDGCISQNECLEISVKLEDILRKVQKEKSLGSDRCGYVVTLPSCTVYSLGPQILIHQKLTDNSFLISVPMTARDKVLGIIHKKGGFYSQVNFPPMLYSNKLSTLKDSIHSEVKRIISQPKSMSSGAVCSLKSYGSAKLKYFDAAYITHMLCHPASLSKLLDCAPNNPLQMHICVNDMSLLQMNGGVAGTEGVCCSSDMKGFLQALGELHLLGHDVNVDYLFTCGDVADCTISPLSHLVSWDHSVDFPMVEWTAFSASEKQNMKVVYPLNSDKNEDSLTQDPLANLIHHIWKSVTEHMKLHKLPRMILKNMHYSEGLTIEDVRDSELQILQGRKFFTISKKDDVLMDGWYDLNPEDSAFPLVPAYDLDINENVMTCDAGEFFKAEISWEDSWPYFINEVLEFGGQYFKNKLLQVYLDPIKHLKEVKTCPKFLAVSEMYTGLCKSGAVTLQYDNVYSNPQRSVLIPKLDEDILISCMNLYQFSTQSSSEPDKMLVYTGTNDQKHVVSLSVHADNEQMCGETLLQRAWFPEDIECFIPLVLAKDMIEKAELKSGKSVTVLPPIDTVGVYVIALACEMGCDVYSSSWDSEKRNLLEEVFIEANIIPAEEMFNVIKEKTAGKGCNACFKLAGGDLKPGLDLLAEGGKMVQASLLSGDEPAIDMSVFLKNIDLYIRDAAQAFMDYNGKTDVEKQKLVTLLDSDSISKLRHIGYPEENGLLYHLDEATDLKQTISQKSLLIFLDEPTSRVEELKLNGKGVDKKCLERIREALDFKPPEFSFFQNSSMVALPGSAMLNRGMMLSDSVRSGCVFNLVNFSLNDSNIHVEELSNSEKNIHYVATPYPMSKIDYHSTPGTRHLLTPYSDSQGKNIPRRASILRVPLLSNIGRRSSCAQYGNLSPNQSCSGQKTSIARFLTPSITAPTQADVPPYFITPKQTDLTYCIPTPMQTDLSEAPHAQIKTNLLAPPRRPDFPGFNTPVSAQLPVKDLFLKFGRTPVPSPAINRLKTDDLLVKLNAITSDGPPLFIVHSALGSVATFKSLGREIKIPCYGIEMGESTPTDSIQSVASYYRNSIELIQPTGPYKLAGYSFGALVALEMAHQWQSASQKVENLIFIEGSPDYSWSLISHGLNQVPDDLDDSQIDDYLEVYILLSFMKIFGPLENENLKRMAIEGLHNTQARVTLAVNLTFGDIIINENPVKTKWLLAKDAVLSKVEKSQPKHNTVLLDTAQEVVKMGRMNKARNFLTAVKITHKYVPTARMFHGDIQLLRVKKDPVNVVNLRTDYGIGNLCDGKGFVHLFNGNHDTILTVHYKNVSETLHEILKIKN